MDDIDVLCDLLLLYVVARGINALLEENGGKVREADSLAFNALGVAACWMEGELARVWTALRERV